jgi:alpha-tubulin suppressor-like RCC1 family protein
VTVLGSNRLGQLGCEGPAVEERPRYLHFHISIKTMACGQDHSHFVSDGGQVYSMGSNESGKLGLGFSQQHLKQVANPTLIAGLQDVVRIACGDHHSLAVDKKGNAYGWGRADQGAIGVRIKVSDEPDLIRVEDKKGKR